MHWDFHSDTPIYLQIAEQFEMMIASGMVSPGDKLLSVREVAIQAGVNPNTVQKALAELEKMGLVCSKRTLGRYVIDDPQRLEQAKSVLVQKLTTRFLSQMERLGLSREDILNILSCADESNKGE